MVRKLSMSDDAYSFSTARARLEEIVTQVRKKDTSLEKSLDLLEEGVRLANSCTELIDHADWTVGGVGDDVTEGVEAEAATMGIGGASVGDVLANSAGEGAVAAESQDVEEGTAADAGPEEQPAPGDAFGDAADRAWSDEGTGEAADDGQE
jgi:exodeoxyribonuclease VII small subunit